MINMYNIKLNININVCQSSVRIFYHLKLCQNLLNYVEIYGDKSSVKTLK